MALHLIKGEDKTILDNLDLSGTNLKTDTPNGSGDKDTEGNDHEDDNSVSIPQNGFLGYIFSKYPSGINT